MKHHGATAFAVTGIPHGADDVEAGLLRTRLIAAAKAFSGHHGPQPLTVTITNQPPGAPTAPRAPTSRGRREADEPSEAERAARFTATAPLHTFDRLVLPARTLDQLLCTPWSSAGCCTTSGGCAASSRTPARRSTWRAPPAPARPWPPT